MKRKILTIIATGSIFCMALTGCGNSSSIPAKSDSTTTIAERSDSSEVESSKEAEKEIEQEVEETKTEETKTDETENPAGGKAGLYQSDGSFIPWDDLGIDVETDYTSDNYKTADRSPYSFLKSGDDCDCLVVADNITNIGNYAFNSCYKITRFDLSNTKITNLGEKAFNGCESLESIQLPDTLISIENNAFNQCYKLTSIEFPNTLTNMKSDAFWACESLESIDLSNTQIIEIGSSAFEKCFSLTSIQLPDTLESIGGSVFYDCTSLTNIDYVGTMEEWNAIDKLDSWNFNSDIKTITCSDGVITL